MKITLTVVDGSFSIHRLPAGAPIPADVLGETFFAVLASNAELSVVCSSAVSVESEKVSVGWSGLKVAGPLDFDMTGIIASISSALSAASVSVFVVSSFDTDYVFVRGIDLDKAVAALQAGGMQCKRPEGSCQ